MFYCTNVGTYFMSTAHIVHTVLCVHILYCTNLVQYLLSKHPDGPRASKTPLLRLVPQGRASEYQRWY